MNASLTKLFGTGLFAIALACVAGPARANEAAGDMIPGDVAAVAQRTNLMVGERVLVAVPKGQQVVVLEVRDGWVGTAVPVNKQIKKGWVKAADLAVVAPAIARVAGDGVYACCSCVELDDFLIGRIYRHESDPNMHVWEPWRHPY